MMGFTSKDRGCVCENGTELGKIMMSYGVITGQHIFKQLQLFYGLLVKVVPGYGTINMTNAMRQHIDTI